MVPNSQRVQLLSNIHDMSVKAQEVDRPRYIEDCVDVLVKTGPLSETEIVITRLVDCFQATDLNILVSDK